MGVLIIVFLILLSGGLLYATVFGRGFEESLPATCASVVMILLLAGFCNILAAGVWIILAAAAVLTGVCVVLNCRKHSWKSTVSGLFTPGFVIFTVLFAVLAFCNRGKLVHEMDAFSHWADVVKSMTIRNSFATDAAALTEFPSYPPGISLFQYLYERIGTILCPSAEFNEGWLYHAYQVFLAAFCMPVFAKCRHKDGLGNLIGAVCVFLAPFFLYYNTYDSLMVDSLIGILSGCGMAYLILSEPDDSVMNANVLAAVAMLCLVKDAGLLFAVFLAVAFALRMILSGKEPAVGKKFRFNWSIGAVLAVAVPKLVWELELAISGAEKSFSDPFDFGVLIRILTGGDTSYRKGVLPDFVERFITGTVEFRNIGIRMTYIGFLFLAFAVLYFLVIRSRKKESGGTFRRVWFWILLVQTVVYAGGLCLAYIFKFNEWEATRLDSFERYIRIGFQAVWMALVLIFARTAQREGKRKALMTFLLLALTVASVPAGPVVCLLSRDNVANSVEERQEFVSMTEKIAENVPADKDVFVMEARDDFGYAYRGIRYLIRPMRTQNRNIRTWCLGGPNNSEDVSFTPEEWREELLKYYDYVAIYAADDYFLERYSGLFADPDGIRDGALYSVNRETGLLEEIL